MEDNPQTEGGGQSQPIQPAEETADAGGRPTTDVDVEVETTEAVNADADPLDPDTADGETEAGPSEPTLPPGEAPPSEETVAGPQEPQTPPDQGANDTDGEKG